MNHDNEDPTIRGGSASPSRRNVVAAAWAAPVVLAAVAAPMAAASMTRSLVLQSDATETVASGESFSPITVLLQQGTAPVGEGEAVVFEVISGDAAFEDLGAVFPTTTYEDGSATAFGLTAGTSSGPVTVRISALGATSLLQVLLIS
ncbi:hypothetical protein GRS96_01265 [Rathayibacter sp. VKM Ac-2803]|uniref:hypothetical protein n=1 Tax=Rathayibacter sp. VKM Ac-2803 TaxID=2609256 RepID=UPI001359CCFC|nr:hypothetical protein [Rathayibacter sp. VKM Ac-2803]MWV47900.1 hypothetical protein [Rathayibacter sp. VKM Ac-2803]